MVAAVQCTTVVTYSSNKTKIMNATLSLQPAVYITNVSPWASVTSLYSLGRWIWTSDPANGMLENVTIKHDFYIACPNQPLTLTTNADNSFNFVLNGITGAANYWPTTVKTNIPTIGIECCTVCFKCRRTSNAKHERHE